MWRLILALGLLLAPTLAAAQSPLLMNGPRPGLRYASGGPTLSYTPVIIVEGHSNAFGQTPTADQTASASRQPGPKVRALAANGTLQQYLPQGFTGMSALGTNTGNVSFELKIAELFVTERPNDTLVFFRLTVPGSTLTRRPSLGSFTGSIGNAGGTGPGNVLTYTGTVNNSELLVGAGIPDGVGTLYQSGSQKVVAYEGTTTQVNIQVPSTTITRHNASDLWHPTQGILWRGNFNNTPTGFRDRILAGLAAMTAAGMSPKIVAVVRMLGENDTDATQYSSFAAANLLQKNAHYADLPMADAKFIQIQAQNNGTAGATIRAAINDLKVNDPTRVEVIEVEGKGYNRWSGVHFDLAALDAIGAEVAAVIPY